MAIKLKSKKQENVDEIFYIQPKAGGLTLPIKFNVKSDGSIWFEVDKSSTRREDLYDTLTTLFSDNETAIEDNTLAIKAELSIYRFDPQTVEKQEAKLELVK